MRASRRDAFVPLLLRELRDQDAALGRESAADMRHLSRLDLGDGGEHRRHQRAKHSDVVARSVNDDYRERKPSEALLIFQIAVKRKKKVELPRRQLQQVAIFHTG